MRNSFLQYLRSLTERFLWPGVNIFDTVANMLLLTVARVDTLLLPIHGVETSSLFVPWVKLFVSVKRREHAALFLVEHWVQVVFVIKMRVYTFFFGYRDSICRKQIANTY